MKENESPVIEIYGKIRRYSFVLPVCMTLMFCSIPLLFYGLREHQSWLWITFGAVFVGSIIVLVVWAIRENRLSEEMLATSARELTEMTAGLELLLRNSSSKLRH